LDDDDDKSSKKKSYGKSKKYWVRCVPPVWWPVGFTMK
jgi:hypothetical protein